MDRTPNGARGRNGNGRSGGQTAEIISIGSVLQPPRVLGGMDRTPQQDQQTAARCTSRSSCKGTRSGARECESMPHLPRHMRRT